MKLLAITAQTFLLLRRDKVFFPAFVVAVLIFIFANLAGDWGIEEFRKILYDIGTMGYHFLGAIIAMFWSTKLIADSKQQGSLEIELASPVSRLSWILGRYLGICCTLMLLSAFLLVVWQAMLFYNGFDWMSDKELLVFAFLTLDWLVLAALAILFGSIASQAVAAFCCLCAWVAGLSSASLVHALSAQTPEGRRHEQDMEPPGFQPHRLSLVRTIPDGPAISQQR